MAYILGAGIRVKFMAIALAVVIVSGSAAIIHTRMVVTRVAGRQLDEHTMRIATELAIRSQDPILTNDTFALYQLVSGTVRANRDVRYAFIVRSDGDILAHTFDEGVPRDLLRLNCDTSKGISLMKVSTEEGIIRDVAAPIVSGSGFVKIGMTQRLLDEGVASSTRALASNVLITSAIALLLCYVITLLFIRPVLDLRRATQALGDGDFRSRARVWWNDEIGYLAMAFNEMAAKLQKSCADVRRKEKAKTKLLGKLMSVQEEERRRIARELHDETSQSLASVNVALGTIGRGDDTKRRTEELRAAISQALDRIRNLAFELRPGLLDDLGLAAAVDRYVEDFRERYGLAVGFQTIGMDGQRLRPEVETAVYRIVQEALVNTAKHAHADHVSVIMELNHGSLRVLVEDDGRGFDSDRTSTDGTGRTLGVFGMQERAGLIGGTLKIESAPGEGTTIALDVPLGD